MTECSECDGTGIVEGPMNHLTGPNPPKVICPECMEECPHCNGTGEVGGSHWRDACEWCDGNGVRRKVFE